MTKIIKTIKNNTDLKTIGNQLLKITQSTKKSIKDTLDNKTESEHNIIADRSKEDLLKKND